MSMKIEELERIEKAVRIIHEPQGCYNSIEQEKLYDSKVIYYVKLNVPVEELECRAKELTKQRCLLRLRMQENYKKLFKSTVG
jgi:hypothetical protein